MRTKTDLRSLSDDALLRRLFELLTSSRRIEADLIAHIAEVDARELYARQAASSMFSYCTDVLHLSEPEAALRIRVARASRQHPMLLTMLRDGRLHLSGIAVLATHLTRENRQTLLKQAAHKSKRRIEEIVAELKPRPDVPARMRKLPTPRAMSTPTSPRLPLLPDGAGGMNAEPGQHTRAEASGQQRPDAVEGRHPERPQVTPTSGEQRPDAVRVSSSRPGSAIRSPQGARSSARPARVEPLAPARYRVEFTASQELHDKLERLQALMRSSAPDVDLGAVIDAAVTEKLERLEAKRLGKTKKPRKSLADTDTTPTSRHVPAAVRRAVWERDGGQCTYVDASGRRCKARERLEFHHHNTPFGRGGDHSPGNVRLACAIHNRLLAEQDFGTEKMAKYRRRPFSGAHVSEPALAYWAGAASDSSPACPPGVPQAPDPRGVPGTRCTL